MNNIPTLPVIEPAIYAGLIKFLNKAIEEDDQESFLKLLKLQLRIRTLELAREPSNLPPNTPNKKPNNNNLPPQPAKKPSPPKKPK